MKSSSVVPRRVFDGGTRVAHVFRGLLTLLRRRTGAGQSRLEKQHEAEAMIMWDSDSPYKHASTCEIPVLAHTHVHILKHVLKKRFTIRHSCLISWTLYLVFTAGGELILPKKSTSCGHITLCLCGYVIFNYLKIWNLIITLNVLLLQGKLSISYKIVLLRNCFLSLNSWWNYHQSHWKFNQPQMLPLPWRQ